MKLNRLGGFYPAAQAIAICESAGIGVSVDTNPYTLLGDTAVLPHRGDRPHSLPGGLRRACELPRHRQAQSLPRWHQAVDGAHASLPDAPGLGVDVDWDAFAEHQKQHARLGVTSDAPKLGAASADDARLRSVLVTGSGSGIGAAIARRLAGPGVGVLVHALHNRAGCEAVAAELGRAGASTTVMLGDLSVPETGHLLVERAVELSAASTCSSPMPASRIADRSARSTAPASTTASPSSPAASSSWSPPPSPSETGA